MMKSLYYLKYVTGQNECFYTIWFFWPEIDSQYPVKIIFLYYLKICKDSFAILFLPIKISVTTQYTQFLEIWNIDEKNQQQQNRTGLDLTKMIKTLYHLKICRFLFVWFFTSHHQPFS